MRQPPDPSTNAWHVPAASSFHTLVSTFADLKKQFAMKGIRRPEGHPLEPIPMLHVEVCPDRTAGKFRIEMNRQYLFAWGMDEGEANLYASFLRTFVDWFDARAMAQYEATVTTASKTVE